MRTKGDRFSEWHSRTEGEATSDNPTPTTESVCTQFQAKLRELTEKRGPWEPRHTLEGGLMSAEEGPLVFFGAVALCILISVINGLREGERRRLALWRRGSLAIDARMGGWADNGRTDGRRTRTWAKPKADDSSSRPKSS